MYRCQSVKTHRPNNEYFLQQWNPETGHWEFVEGTPAVSDGDPTFQTMFGLEGFSTVGLPGDTTGLGWCSKDPLAVLRAINWLNGGTGDLPLP